MLGAKPESLMEERDTRWIPVVEVVRHLGVAQDTVHRWIESRGRPAHRVGRFWRFQLSEVDGWAKSGEADIANGIGRCERLVDSLNQER